MRASTVGIVVAFAVGLSVACGSTASNSDFPDGGSETDSGSHQNTSSSGTIGGNGGGNSEGGSSSGDDDTVEAGCGDACVTAAVCGDGQIEPGEQCDDGNSVPGDGCSGTCQIEPGYTCPTVGEACLYTVTVLCGDGKIEGNEGCDDGNKNDGDGCSAGCQVEPGYQCTTPGQACTPVVQPRCGDGTVDFGEQCDDGNNTASDGCSPTCQIETGYTCPTPGSPCVKLQYCGDGIVQTANGEQCDDGNAVPGDGCSGVCRTEPGYSCTTPGQPCTRVWVCGNGKVDPGEACDDGNTSSGDGCSADCTLVEAGYTCPDTNGTGGACTKAPTNVCGDGIVAGNEQCDDGNKNSGDGCSSTCAVEAGYTCPTAGKKCTKIPVCGDGTLDPGEACDDGNKNSGDGCSAQCTLEPNYQCPTPGQKCQSTVVCGDGKISGNETCDDHNQVSGDGCSSTCSLEPGWTCPVVGAACSPAKCGDGYAVGTEQCDDGNTNSGDGCSSTCTLEVKVTTVAAGTGQQPSQTYTYYKCTPAAPTTGPQTCSPTVCGNGGGPEGSEQCDDGNNEAYDGCSPQCQIEPHCPGGTCKNICGDGVLANYVDAFGDPAEACDDGNTQNGDGCSSTCQVESGYSCTNSAGTAPATLDVPVVIRDMKYWAYTKNGAAVDPSSHPDFERYACSTISPNLVNTSLSTCADGSCAIGGVPTFNTTTNGAGYVSADGKTNCGTQLTSATDFTDWYRDITVNDVNTNNTSQQRNKRIDGHQIQLNQQADGSYVFDSANDEPYKDLGGWFPIDGQGWGNQGASDNFSFTTEFRYWFTYDNTQSPTLAFSGDDDVWVFVNGQLALDIGGLHPREAASFQLTPTLAQNKPTDNPPGLGLVNGHLYEIALFNAERHTNASNFKLTLKGFVKNTSVCTPVCGDGIRTATEQCDLGAKNASPAPYGGCSTSCTLGPYCGDKTVENPPETCDDGTNSATYGGTQKVCSPTCTYAPYCGDGTISNGEQCDDGTANNTGAYGKCGTNCTLGARCGDGITNGPEQCDDGSNNGQGVDKCNANCTLRCGDGKVESGEACDNGTANNTGGYGKCNPDCTEGPYCGDGVKNGNEQCDDGKNDGTYGTCAPGCVLAGYCGDGTVQNPPETCDQGAANSSTAYGKNTCTNRCTPGPYCGDKQVDGEDGEVCDDGVNNGQPGSCSTDCTQFIPNPTCGNGKIDAGEQCDNGTANNGQPGNACDAHCHNTCGNGVKDPGETCDNGVDDGSYGGCTTTCQLAGYCGDGKVQNPPETCDQGANNQPVSSAYGVNVCTQACTYAGYCGDGRIQSDHGEQCDGGPNCDSTCHTTGPK